MTVKNSILSRSPATFAPAQQPKPQDIAPLFAQGLALHQAGRLAEAEAVYHQVLAARPGHFDSLHLLGVIYLQRGNHAKAVQQIDLALKVDPDNVPALNNRGNALNDLRRFDDALASFDRVLRLKPDNAEAHSGRGNTLKELGRYDEALADYDRALALRPDYAQAHSNRASALHALSLFEDALAACDRALALQADFAGALSNRGNALKELGRYEAAIESYDRAIALQPAFAEAHSNRGNALHELHRFEDALAGYDRALALRPDFAEAHSNRGNALQELRRHDEAVASYDRALLLRPDMAEVHSNRGNALTELRQFERALESFDRAQALRPDLADAHFNAALCRLLTGDFVRGWEEYEWRWGTAQLKDARRNFARQQWSGSEQIAGKTILVHAEQGFGDTLQFCRYVPHLAARGARVILEVQKPLHSLMSTLSGAAQIVSRGDRLPHFDLHSPLLSLPRAFGTKPGTIPSDTPYLSASAGKTAAWRARLGDDDRLRVGLVWAGSSRKELPNAARIDRQRSIAFDRLQPVLQVTGCAFYSLQKGGEPAAQLRASEHGRAVIDWTEELHDFSDTAALVANLDIVVAVDTAVAHLAGALGKPFLLMNRYNTCWRWLLDRDDSPWYPAARQFRQDETRTWEPVIARVADALRACVHSRDLTDRRRQPAGIV